MRNTEAVLYLEQAGDRAQAQYANVAAEGSYRELVDRLDRLGHRLAAARAREKLGAVLTTMGRGVAALELLEQAAETYHAAGDLERWGGALAQIGKVHTYRETPEEGVARLHPVVAQLGASAAEGVSTRCLARLYAALADLFFVAGRYSEQLVAATRAAELARLA